MDALYQISFTIISWLQNLSPSLDVPMEILTFMGTFEFYMLFIPVLYWLVDPGLGLRILYLLVAVDSLGTYFKHLFHQPRPYWMRDFKMSAQETSYGIPSTHASDSLAVWGYLAYSVRKNWMWVLSTVLVLLIGISRMYLAVHFLHDVLFGWLLGFVILFLFIRTESQVLAWWNKNSISLQIAYAFLLSVVLILVGLLIVMIISPAPDQQFWADHAGEARTINGYITLGGALFGAIAGGVLMKQYARFQVQGSLLLKVARYVLGIVGVLICYRGLDLLFGWIAPDQSVLGYILRYVRYGSVTLWAIFGAPWVFIKLKLAARDVTK